ncbi:MAG: peptide chain release factor aRF-1 [Candidatus Diapherotrites archaeon]
MIFMAFEEQASETERMLFAKKMKKLKSIKKGSGTELISLYIPHGTDRSSVMNQLTEEKSQSSNIKDSNTRKNVQGALKKVINFLKRTEFNIPKKGLAVFAGNVSQQEGKPDIKLFTVKPIKKLETKLYWCDSEFNLKPLEAMSRPTEVYGLLTIDKNEATIALLSGKKYEIIGQFKSRVAGKFRAGGQSAKRFEHLRQEAEHNFYIKISEKMNEIFLKDIDKIKGIVIGGPGMTKDYFLQEGLLDHRIKAKIIGVVSTSYTDESGIRELVHNAADVLKEAEVMMEIEIVKEFMHNVIKTGLAAYGEKEVLQALENGQVKTLLVSEALEKTVFTIECIKCGNIEKHTARSEAEVSGKKCGKCGAETEIVEETEYIDRLQEMADRIGAETRIISTDTDEGMQFLKAFGGIGAILRYK